MRWVILGGDFEGYDGLNSILYQVEFGGGRFEIYDLRNLWDLRMPNDVKVDDVDWIGWTYSFNCDSMSDQYVSVQVSTKEVYQAVKQRHIEDRQGEVLSEVKLTDRNATQTLYKDRELKQLRYEIEDGARTIWVCEEYDPRADDPDVPRRVYFGFDGNDQEGAFSGSVLSPEERPSMEWLASFGLKKVS